MSAIRRWSIPASRAVACAAWVALAACAAHAGELVVIEARGLSLQAGQVIDDTKPLVLEEGQRGPPDAADRNTPKLSGPHDQAPGAGGSAACPGLSEALLGMLG